MVGLAAKLKLTWIKSDLINAENKRICRACA